MAKRINKFIVVLFCLLAFLGPLKSHAFEVINNISTRNAFFTGRVSYLNKIEKMLARYGKVYLTGYGGIGKTQLAKEFSYIHNSEYDLMWWFDLSDNIELQYENLLTHLSNNESFKKILHINVKDIAPSVLVDFTNSLLEKNNCKWLLVFDGVIDSRNIKLPKVKTAKQHIIVTTREKQNTGNNVLTICPFDDQESEQFLFKIHPQEKKEDIVKLYKILHNFPLALAQASEEILMRKEGIKIYLETHDESLAKPELVQSDITQDYNNNYREILDQVLQNIEQKDKESAKVLYMLALLKTNITKKLLRDLFGNEIEDKLITLSKYGIIQIVDYKNSQVLNIHDVIREMAIKKFNNKDILYRKKIILTLSKHFSNLCLERGSQYFNNVDSNSIRVASLYLFINLALQNNIINDEVINIVIVALQLSGSSIINKYDNYSLYQQIANEIYSKNLDNITYLKKALLYVNLVYADFIFNSEGDLLKFEKEILRLVELVERDRDYKTLFIMYIKVAYLYLFLGEFKTAKGYLEKAERNVNYVDIIEVVQYWYIRVRVLYELREVKEAEKACEIYEKLMNQLPSNTIDKFSFINFKIRIKLFNGQYNEARKELTEAIKNTNIYYHNTYSLTVGRLEFIKAIIYFLNKQYNLAEKQCKLAINITIKATNGDMVSYVQAGMHVLLGEIYEGQGHSILALKEYKKSLNFYDHRTYGRVSNFYEYGESLANLCYIYYKQKNYLESKLYFQKLVTNFGLGHKIVDNLMKKLPHDFIIKLSGAKYS